MDQPDDRHGIGPVHQLCKVTADFIASLLTVLGHQCQYVRLIFREIDNFSLNDGLLKYAQQYHLAVFSTVKWPFKP